MFKLESIQTNNLRFIEESAFKSCTKLDTIDLSKIIYIDNNAFEGCNLVSSTINLNNVDYIGSDVFLNTSIDNTIYLNEKKRDLFNVTYGYNRNFYGKPGITIKQVNTGFDDRTTIITFNNDETFEFNATETSFSKTFITNFFDGTNTDELDGYSDSYSNEIINQVNTIKSIRLGSNFTTIGSYTLGAENSYADYEIKIGYKMNNTGTGWNEQNFNYNSFFLTKGTASSAQYYKMYVKQNGIKQYIKNNTRTVNESILYPSNSNVHNTTTNIDEALDFELQTPPSSGWHGYGLNVYSGVTYMYTHGTAYNTNHFHDGVIPYDGSAFFIKAVFSANYNDGNDDGRYIAIVGGNIIFLHNEEIARIAPHPGDDPYYQWYDNGHHSGNFRPFWVGTRETARVGEIHAFKYIKPGSTNDFIGHSITSYEYEPDKDIWISLKDIWLSYVTTINSSAFRNNHFLETVTFGESLEIIDNNAFENCSS